MKHSALGAGSASRATGCLHAASPELMANDYVIESDLGTGSVPEVLALWVRNLHGYSQAGAQAKVQFGYLANPAAPGVLLALRPGPQQPLCGAQGLHPRRMHLGERSLLAAGLADFVVDMAHRSVGPALMLTRQAVQLGRERFALLYGLPNDKAKGVCLRAGMRKLGVVHRYAKLLHSGEILRRTVPAWMAAVLAPAGNVLLHLVDVFLQLRQRQRLVLRDVPWNDPAIDALWERRPRDVLLSERNSAMLRWRCAEVCRGQWTLSLAADNAGATIGYLIWHCEQGFAQVCDFFSAEPARDTAPMFLALSRRLRREGVRALSVEFFGRRDVVQALRQAGLLQRPQENLLVMAPSPAMPALDDPQNWYLTEFDNDAN